MQIAMITVYRGILKTCSIFVIVIIINSPDMNVRKLRRSRTAIAEDCESSSAIGRLVTTANFVQNTRHNNSKVYVYMMDDGLFSARLFLASIDQNGLSIAPFRSVEKTARRLFVIWWIFADCLCVVCVPTFHRVVCVLAPL